MEKKIKGNSEKTNTKEKKINDLFDIMLKKAEMKKEDVYKICMKNFIMNNLDLLSDSELKEFEHLFAK